MSSLIIQCGNCGTYTSSALHTCNKYEVSYNNKIYPIYAQTPENAAEKLSEKLNKLVEVEINEDFYVTHPRAYVGIKQKRKIECVVSNNDTKETKEKKGKDTGGICNETSGTKSKN